MQWKVFSALSLPKPPSKAERNSYLGNWWSQMPEKGHMMQMLTRHQALVLPHMAAFILAGEQICPSVSHEMALKNSSCLWSQKNEKYAHEACLAGFY